MCEVPPPHLGAIAKGPEIRDSSPVQVMNELWAVRIPYYGRPAYDIALSVSDWHGLIKYVNQHMAIFVPPRNNLSAREYIGKIGHGISRRHVCLAQLHKRPELGTVIIVVVPQQGYHHLLE